MSAETIRLLHLVLDKLDRLADKGDEADWRAVAAIILEETRDDRYHPRPSRLREILAIAERHMIKGVPPVKPNVETERKVKRDVVPAPDALGKRAPAEWLRIKDPSMPHSDPDLDLIPGLSPVAGMETTAEDMRILRLTVDPARVGRLLRDHDRLAAEIARLTAELAEAQDKCRAWEATCVDLTADCYEADSKLEQARAYLEKAREEEQEAASQFMDSVTRGLYLRARSTGGET